MTDASFGSLRLWISEVFDFACLLACFVSFFHLLSSHFYTCFRLVFPLALAFLVDLLRVSTCFVLRLASCCDLLRLDLSTSLRALAVNSLGGLIIFRMLGAYVGSLPGTLILALWVNYRYWTSLSLSALWSFILASPVGSSLSLNVIALPTTYLL